MPRSVLPVVALAGFCLVAPLCPAAGAAASDEAVLAAALAALEARHVDPQPPAQRLLAALRGLRGADPALSVSLSSGRIELGFGAGQRSLVPAPAEGDAAAWARAGALAIEAAASGSARLRALSPARRRALVLEEMASGLDPFTRWVPATEAALQRRARTGVGSTGLTLEPAGASARIAKVEPESPAWRSGLAPGDRVLAIDGATTRGLAAEDLSRLLAGEAGAAVTLTVARRGGAARTVVLVRAAVLPETARLGWSGRVPVLSVSAFAADTDQATARLVAGLAARQPAPEAILLDLRGNRGGLLPVAVGVADVFLAAGEVVHARGRHPDASRTYLAGGADLAEGIRLAVLVDGATASAAEAVAAALQDQGRAVIVGSATRGKGLVQRVTPLPDGSELHISWARLLRAGGQPIQKAGIVPDLCTSRGAEEARAQVRRLLAAAIDTWRAAEEDRVGCPPAEGSALDIEAALWLFRSAPVPTAGEAGVVPAR